MAGKKVLIKDLIDDTGVHRIDVKVVYKWRSYEEDGSFHGINIVLADVEDNRIHATILKYITEKKKNFVEPRVDCYYFIHKFFLKSNLGTCRPTPHENRINFHMGTVCVLKEDLDFKTSPFNFVSFDDIINRSVDVNVLRDIIGQVKIVDQNAMEASNKGIDLDYLDNRGNKFTVRLWGKYAEAVQDYTNNHANGKSFTMIMQYAKIKLYQGSPTVGNAYHVTNLLFNPDNDYVRDFMKQRRLVIGNEEEVLESQSITPVKSEEYCYFEEHPKATLKYLNDVAKPGFYATVGKIMTFFSDKSWFYAACTRCPSGVVTDDNNGIKCPRCNIGIPIARPRYRVSVVVTDYELTDATITIWDRDVEDFIGHSAFSIREEQTKTNTEDNFPEALEKLLKTWFIFVIKSTDKIYKGKKTKEFSVNKMTARNDLVDKFQLLMLRSPDVLGNVKIEKDGECGVGSTISSTKENTLTPGSDINYVTPHKRNLDDVSGKEDNTNGDASVTKKAIIEEIGVDLSNQMEEAKL